MTAPNKVKKDRFTIYAKQKERKELLEKVLQYVDSDSLSEAIFKALDQFVEMKEKRRKNRMKRHAAKTKGIWADDPEIDKALEEIDKRWETWEPMES